MRVLLLNPYLPPPPGGIERELLAVAGELRRLGHEVAILTTTARFPSGRNPAPGPVPSGVAVVRRPGLLRSTLRGFAPSRAPLLVPGLARAARAARPELVLAYNLGWGPALRPALAALRGRAAILYRPYWHPPGGRLRGLKTRYLAGTVARADLAVAACGDERDRLLATGRLDPRRVAVVAPGVDAWPADPARVAALRRALDLQGRFAIAHVARLSPFKGTDDLVAVLPRVREATGRDVVLLLAGPGGEAYRGAAHVRVAGEVADDRELRLHLAASSLFALPSAYEALGFVFLEAQAEGLAAVGCDVGGTREAIGEAGVVVPRFGDRQALQAALVELVGDDARRAAMGAAGRARVEGLTWRRTAEALLALAAQVAPGQGCGRG